MVLESSSSVFTANLSPKMNTAVAFSRHARLRSCNSQGQRPTRRGSQQRGTREGTRVHATNLFNHDVAVQVRQADGHAWI
jgi:hypothetical protein